MIPLALWGCAPDDGRVVTVEANDLGVIQLEIEHATSNGDRVLTLSGLDRDGTVIAAATLRTGLVSYGADMPVASNVGTELTITIGATNGSFVTPDLEPHENRAPVTPALATFVRLNAVALSLNAEAGIRFAPVESAYQQYTAADCTPDMFPLSQGPGNDCCASVGSVDQKVDSSVHVISGGSSNNKLGMRSYNLPCRTSSGGTGCTGAQCSFGPCGARVDGVLGSGSPAAKVFIPPDMPTLCGYDGGGYDYWPEQYSGQELYPDAGHSCDCTGCNSDGTPTPAGCGGPA